MTEIFKDYIKNIICNKHKKIKKEDIYIWLFKENSKDYIQITIFRGYTPLGFLKDAIATYGPKNELWKEVIYERKNIITHINKW